MSAANRKRGQRAEVAVVNFLREQGWPDARRYLSGDGRQPGDIDWHPLVCLEVKDRAESAWPSWCRQAADEAPAGTIPAVVRRKRGKPDAGGWECRVNGALWLLVLDDPETSLYPLSISSHTFGTDRHDVDGTYWYRTTLAVLAAAVRAIDADPVVRVTEAEGGPS